MSLWTEAGIFLVLAAIVFIGLESGRKVSNSEDFATGGASAGSWLVCGSIMGSLVSSQATIGTAQLAFNYGISALWFTLGSAMGCLLLGLGYGRAMRHSGCVTELQIISREYGLRTGLMASILSSIGIFISILAQMVAFSGLFTSLFPNCSLLLSACLAAALMCVYTVFGGALGTGVCGVTKLILLAAASTAGLIYALAVEGGVTGLMTSLNDMLAGTRLGTIQSELGLPQLTDSEAVNGRFFNLLARGTQKDIGSCMSIVLGVLSTQTYAQAIWSGKSDMAAKRGAMLSALLIPPIGLAGVAVGLFMRANYITQAEVNALAAAGLMTPDIPVIASTIQVFPTFIIRHFPPLCAGIALGTLLLTIVGGGAGLSFGMSTVLIKDVIKRIIKSLDVPVKELKATRYTILVVLMVSAGCATFISGSTINDLGFLSMGLRATVVFAPLSCALLLKNKLDGRFVCFSVIAAPISVLVARLLWPGTDTLWLGMLVSIAFCALGFARKKNTVSS